MEHEALGKKGVWGLEFGAEGLGLRVLPVPQRARVEKRVSGSGTLTFCYSQAQGLGFRDLNALQNEIQRFVTTVLAPHKVRPNPKP